MKHFDRIFALGLAGVILALAFVMMSAQAELNNKVVHRAVASIALASKGGAK